FANLREKLIESLNPIRLTVRVKPGSFLGISHHFLGAPFELENDEVLREFLEASRRLLEEGGFGLDVIVISHTPYLEDLVLENLERIENLNYRFHGSKT
ncbi:MAG: hypothetical protein NZM36_01590, partial [Aquificaceae bacterium]|nr:hypothetical protein [Aquificaceae bacterium]